MPLQDDLDRLEVTIRQLQVKWELFFNGQEKKPPSEIQVERKLPRQTWVVMTMSAGLDLSAVLMTCA